MKIYVCPADLQGCGYYRLIWAAKALIKQGHNIEIIWPAQRDNFLKGELDPKTKKIVGVRIPDDADVIVLQRVTNNYLSQAIKHIVAKGVAVVIDMDDDLSSIHPENPAFGYLRPGKDKEHTWENARQSCMDATIVTVSTPALLKRYAPHGRGTVLYNMIPGPFLTIPHVDNTDVGWGGSTHSHPNDLPILGTPVSQWLQDGITFRTVGPPDRVAEKLGLRRDIEQKSASESHPWPTRDSTLQSRGSSHLSTQQWAYPALPLPALSTRDLISWELAYLLKIRGSGIRGLSFWLITRMLVWNWQKRVVVWLLSLPWRSRRGVGLKFGRLQPRKSTNHQ
jgi:hypothetical protein